MRLINADKLLEDMRKTMGILEEVEEVINAQPTAYDVDKVVWQLEALGDGKVDMGCCPYVENDEMTCARCYTEKAATIVKQGGVS